MKKKLSDQYLKIVEWSEEDKCYVGTAPGLILGGVHGKNEVKVFNELCQVVEEAISIMQKDGMALPQPTVKKNYSGKIALRIPEELHKIVAIKAMTTGQSLNKFIRSQLEQVII